jgi:hypothetical protein
MWASLWQEIALGQEKRDAAKQHSSCAGSEVGEVYLAILGFSDAQPVVSSAGAWWWRVQGDDDVPERIGSVTEEKKCVERSFGSDLGRTRVVVESLLVKPTPN